MGEMGEWLLINSRFLFGVMKCFKFVCGVMTTQSLNMLNAEFTV